MSIAPTKAENGLLAWPERLLDPETGLSVSDYGTHLETVTGTSYPIIDGIPDFLGNDRDETDRYTQANIGYYESVDRRRYELMWSQYVDPHAYRRIRRIIEDTAGVPLRPGTVYLDAGCGFGYFALNLLEAPEIVEHHAIDVHRQGLRGTLDRARSGGRRIQVARGTLYHLPYKSNTFHLITGNGVLHHLDGTARAAEQIADQGGPHEVISRYLSDQLDVLRTHCIGDRPDRAGNGDVRITRNAFENPGGQENVCMAGMPVTVTMDYQWHAEANRRPVALGFTIWTLERTPVAECRTSYNSEPVTLDGPTGTVECEIPSLPLVPGQYLVDFCIKYGNETYDWLQNALILTVESSDFLGGTRMDSSVGATLLLKQNWRATAKRYA